VTLDAAMLLTATLVIAVFYHLGLWMWWIREQGKPRVYDRDTHQLARSPRWMVNDAAKWRSFIPGVSDPEEYQDDDD
jgi:uncharacterized iron-regulated membrane protein